MCCPGITLLGMQDEIEALRLEAARGFEPADDDGADGAKRHGRHGRHNRHGSLFEVDTVDETADGKFGVRCV
ncbi:MAG: hypothetical protein UZ22_OP11002000518 [Microgenomates bacterium OLB23]|nr:MAG: hypothetical protein UZ22_OP11002000518 [Microgenomates bacterium OLB23]